MRQQPNVTKPKDSQMIIEHAWSQQPIKIFLQTMGSKWVQFITMRQYYYY